MGGVRTIQVSGSPYEMGHQHGSQCRDLIRGFIQAHLEALVSTSAHDGKTHLAAADVLALARQNAAYIANDFPAVWQEMQGIAEGAQCALDDIVAINCFCDFQDLFWPRLASQRLWGCTTFAVARARSASGRTLIGENFDILSKFEDYNMLLVGRPAGGPRFVCYTLAGVVGCLGMAEQGLAVAINRLSPADARPGVPYPVIIRGLLAAPNTSKALDSILRPRRASGLMYVMADAHGVIFPVETTATDYDILHMPTGVIAHTNHYVSDNLRAFAHWHRPFAANTICRLQRANAILASTQDIDRGLLMTTVLADHTNYPTSICRHSDEKSDPRTQTKTIAAVVMEPEDQRFHFCSGNPCTSTFVEFSTAQLWGDGGGER